MIDPETILVTGGGGMLATAFRAVLPRVTFLDKAALDICDVAAVERELEQRRPRILINCAAYTKVDAAEQNEWTATVINGYAPGVLARQCAKQDITLVHFSTDYVFDGTLRRPLRPDDPVAARPSSAYGRSKLWGERAIQANPPPRWLIIRSAWLHGPGGPCFPLTILKAAWAGKPLTVVDDQTGSPTYTLDLARATLQLIEHGATGIWHLVNDGQATWHEFAVAVLKAHRFNVPVARITSQEWKALHPQSAERPLYSVLDPDTFGRWYGCRLRHWRDTPLSSE